MITITKEFTFDAAHRLQRPDHSLKPVNSILEPAVDDRLDALVVEVVPNPHDLVLLSDPVDAPDALFDAHGIPGHVEVDQHPAYLEVESLAHRLGSHQDPDLIALAEERLDLLFGHSFPRSSVPDLPTSTRVAPHLRSVHGDQAVRGVVWNRVLAGMLVSKDGAEDLLEALVRDGVKDAANAWDIRPTWLAFRFGTYPNLQDARATVETLEGLGIPAYLIRASGRAAGRGQAYHVYAGGYDNQAIAQPLADQIARAGLEAELVERMGLPPQ